MLDCGGPFRCRLSKGTNAAVSVCRCFKVTNLSPQREVQIEHVWYQGTPQVALLAGLPARLDETWEECIPAARVAHISEVEHARRVRLSNGKIIRSRPNRNLPPVGRMAGHGSE